MTTTDTPPTRQAPDLVGVLLDVAKGREQYAEGAPKEAARVLLNEAAAYRVAAAIAAGDRSSLPFLLPSWTWAQVDTREPAEPTLRGQVLDAVMAVSRDLTTGEVVRITDAVLRVTEEDKRAALQHAANVAQAALDAAERDHLATIDERDHLHEIADRLAACIAPEEVLGEHSSMNDPWQNALDYAYAEQDADAAAHSAAEPDPGEDDERAVEGYHASQGDPWTPHPSRAPIDPIHFDVEEARRQGWSFDPWTSRAAIAVEQARRTTMRDLRRRRAGWTPR